MEPHQRRRTTRQEVASRLREELRKKSWPANTQLPPLRQLAELYGASYVTMRRALLDLQTQGLVVVRQGAGIYVSPELDETKPVEPEAPEAQSRRVALVLPSGYGEPGMDLSNGLIAGFLRAAELRRWEAVPILSCDGRCAAPGFPDELEERRVNGVVWIEPRLKHQMNLMRLQDRGIAVVGFGRRFPGMPFPTVTMNIRHLAHRIAAECADEGRSRLGFLTPPLEEPDGDPVALERLAALREACRELERPIRVDPVVPWLPALEAPSALGAQLKPHFDVTAWVLVLQTYVPSLVKLAHSGFWNHPEDVYLYDMMGYGLRQLPTDFGGLNYVRVAQPALEMGRALACELERIWTGTTSEPPPDLRPGLVRVTPPAVSRHLADVS